MRRKLLALTVFMVAISTFSVALQKPINAFAFEDDAVVYADDGDQVEPVKDECHKPLGELAGDCKHILGSIFNYLTASDATGVSSGGVFDKNRLNKLITEKNVKMIYNSTVMPKYIINGNSKPPRFQTDFKFDLSLKNIEPSMPCSRYSFYYMEQIKYVHYTLSIENGVDKSTYANCFSERFINALNELKDNTISIEEFIHRYGTHIVWSVDYGQTLNYVMEFHADEADEDEFFTLAYDAAINGVDNSEFVKKYGNKYNICFYSRGMLITDSLFKRSYVVDDKSTSSSDVKNEPVFIGCGDNDFGLVPLWEILPDEYADVANIIKTEYDKRYAEREKEFEEKLNEQSENEEKTNESSTDNEGDLSQSGSGEQTKNKGCASSVSSSCLLCLIPCAVVALLIKKRIDTNNTAS